MKSALILLMIFISAIVVPDISHDISKAMNAGNAKELSQYIANNVDLKILDKEGVYSKAQAELIIKNFFSKHPVKSFTVAHESASNSSVRYIIGTLTTTNGQYRTYFLLKKLKGPFVIQQFRIEANNE